MIWLNTTQKMKRPISTIILITAIIALFGRAFALSPCEVLVVVNADEPKSISIGSYYIRSRNLPESNLAALRLGSDNNATISSSDYEQKIAAPLRNMLKRAEYSHIRCLLTTYKVPYKITPSPMSREDAAVKSELENFLENQNKYLAEEIANLSPATKTITYKNTEELIGKSKQKIAEIIEKIKEMEQNGAKSEKKEQFLTEIEPVYGVFILTQLADAEFNHTYRPPPKTLETAIKSRIFIQKAVNESWNYQECLNEGYYDHFCSFTAGLSWLNCSIIQ